MENVFDKILYKKIKFINDFGKTPTECYLDTKSLKKLVDLGEILSNFRHTNITKSNIKVVLGMNVIEVLSEKEYIEVGRGGRAV